MAKTQRWEWAIGLDLEELDDQHLQAAYKLNWDNLCKFDNCRKNCKRILCLACFDRSWIDNDSANNSNFDNFDTSNCEQRRIDLKTFVGLKNLGATCYVNCLLQLLFHNPALRKAIYEWDRNSHADIIHDDAANTSRSITSSESINQKEASRITPKRPRDNEDYRSPSKRTNKNSVEKSLVNASPETKVQQTSTLSPALKSQIEDAVKANPIEQLQLIFARMQFTNKKSIDPFNFIESLALNAAEQQDAQEFGNLVMGFLEKSFTNQKNSFVSKIIQNQFCGRYSYATICDHCKHSSLSDSNFYELDLSIQNLETLHDCLNEYFRPVPLDGKYNCSRCQKSQSAHRKIILKSLPPTLNLQLLRFVYDVQRSIRQKLNSHIIFPEILDMNPYLKSADVKSKLSDSSTRSRDDPLVRPLNGHSKSTGPNIYILSAVLIHRGSSPHSGHYIAHIKDRITKDWYKFNDDCVERIGPQLQVSTDGENITIVDGMTETFKLNDPSTGKITKVESKSLKSKTAYMLVYQAQNNEALTYPSDHSDRWILPYHLQAAVAEENSKSEELFESLQVAKELDQQIMDVRKSQVRTIYEELVCRDPSEEFEFINKTWLQRWLTNSSTSAKFPEIDNSELLCIHDKLDFRKLDQVKCIRSAGADKLYQEFGGGPRLKDAMCRQCVELEVRLIQIKDRLKEDQKYITSQAKFKLEANYDFADAYIVGKNSYRDWQALVMVQFEKSHPELLRRKSEKNSHGNAQISSDEDDQKQEKNVSDNQEPLKNNGNNNSNSESDDEAIEKFVFNSDILCQHNQLINDTSAWRIVPKEVWTIFRNYFGSDPLRPLIENNANTIMCAECKRQEMELQEFGDIQKMKASEQKAKLPDLFHNRKRASWCSMLPGDEYYALDRQFLSKWQKFIRNPSHQEEPTVIRNCDKLICDHGKSLYNYSNSNPVLPDCPFVLISAEELSNLKLYYSTDAEIKFAIKPKLADEKLKLYFANPKSSTSKKPTNTDNPAGVKQIDISGDTHAEIGSPVVEYLEGCEPKHSPKVDGGSRKTQLDLSEIDWSECVFSQPDFCSECHEMLKQDELKKLLNYESATIYITKIENSTSYGPQNNPNLTTNGGSSTANDNCDIEPNQQTVSTCSNEPAQIDAAEVGEGSNENDYPKRRKKIYVEDEANDFVPPGASKQSSPSVQSSNSILRRTTRRNRNREQAYTIKPNQTLLQLKKEIFARCQVLPVDQRLFLNDILLDDNSKTMSELRIVPNCSLKLEVDKPISDNIDLIEDEPMSRKSCAQPETGFKGSLLLSNSRL